MLKCSYIDRIIKLDLSRKRQLRKSATRDSTALSSKTAALNAATPPLLYTAIESQVFPLGSHQHSAICIEPAVVTRLTIRDSTRLMVSYRRRSTSF